MKKAILGCALALVAVSANAKDKLIPLSAADAAALQGKTIALTTHERPSFVAMTAGKAAFALLGSAGMIKAGNDLVDSNQVTDPASIVREALATALRDAYGAKLLPADPTPTKAKKAKQLAAAHPEADLVLDVHSGGWNYGYYATEWSQYWVGYSVQVQLVDTKSGALLSNAACNANTQQNPNRPSREQLHADNAKLLKDVTAGLGWICVQLLAKEQFRITPDKVAAIPTAYVDPLAALTTAPAVPASEVQADSPPAAAASATETGASDAAPAVAAPNDGN